MIGSMGRQYPTVEMTPDLEKLCEWMFQKFNRGNTNYKQSTMYPDDWQRLAKALVDTFDIDISRITKKEMSTDEVMEMALNAISNLYREANKSLDYRPDFRFAISNAYDAIKKIMGNRL